MCVYNGIFKFCFAKAKLSIARNKYAFFILCLKMKKVLAFEELDFMRQNLSSVENGEGIFILDNKGNIVFANRKAEYIRSYVIKEEIKRKLKKKKVVIERNGKKITLYPIMEGDDIKFFFGLIKDDELKKMEEEIDKMQKRFESFKENMSHYFFNPLVIAKGYLDLLMEKDLEKDEKESIIKIKNAIDRIENVVKNIVIEGKIKE